MGRWRTLLWVFLIALAVRGAFVATRGNALVWPDSEDYHSIARSLQNGDGFVSGEGKRASRAPVYPLFLAACYSAGMESPRAVFLVQAFAGAIMCILITLLGRRLHSDRAGATAGFISAFYPFFIYYTGLMLTETLFILGLVGYVLCLTSVERAFSQSNLKLILLSIGTGLLAGVLVLLRSSLFLFPFFFDNYNQHILVTRNPPHEVPETTYTRFDRHPISTYQPSADNRAQNLSPEQYHRITGWDGTARV